MNMITRITIIALFLSLTACANLDRRGSTVVGAGVGAASGAIISGGDPLATIGGAIIGGVIGNASAPRYDRSYGRSYNPQYRNQRQYNNPRYEQRDRRYDNYRR